MKPLAKVGKCAAGALVVICALACAIKDMACASEVETPQTQVRRDRFKDPLPEGAEFRLGTVGFRVPNMAGVGFRPTGEMVAFTEDLMLHVWPADGTPNPKIINVTGKPEHRWHRALSANARFAAGMVDRKLVVWDVSGDKPVEYLSHQANSVYKISFSPDGAWLALNDDPGGDKGNLQLCNLARKSWDQLPVDGDYVESLSFSRDGKLLVVVAGGGEVSVIDTATCTEKLRATIPRVRPSFAAVSPDGKVLAVLPTAWIHGPEPTVRFLSVASGKEIAEMKAPSFSGSWLGFSPNGKTLLLGNRHGIREWDLSAGKWLREIAGPADHPAVYSADGRRLVAHSDNAVLLWDAEKQRHVRRDLIEGGHTDAILGITVSPDGQLIATDALDEDVRMWRTDSGKPLFRVGSSWGTRPAFLPDSKTFIAIADDYVTPVVRDATTGRELRRFVVPPEFAKKETSHDLHLSADGKILTTTTDPITSGDKSFTVQWEVATGRQIERTEFPNDRRGRFLFPTITSPDGKWSIKEGTLSRTGTKDSIPLVDGRESWMIPPRFSPDSRLVAAPRTPWREEPTDRERGSLVLYSLTAKSLVTELPTGRVMRHVFSPDGRELAVVGRKEITLWDLVSLKTVRRFPMQHGSMLRQDAMAFTRDGRRLITGQDDCTALVWDLTGTGRASGATAPRLSANGLKQMWDTLANSDAPKAHTGAWELTDRGEQTVAFLRDHLKPVTAADKDAVRRLLVQLNADAFDERETATRSLRDMEDSAVPALRAALRTRLSAEVRSRVERLLAEAAASVPSSGRGLQQVRAIVVLQQIGSKGALKLLEELAGGLADARLTREASESLRMLKR